MDVTDQLGDAIKERRIITFRYAGTDFRIRPYRIKEMDAGDLALGGKTEFGEWREFAVHKIAALKVTDATFKSDSDYDSKSTEPPQSVDLGYDSDRQVLAISLRMKLAHWILAIVAAAMIGGVVGAVTIGGRLPFRVTERSEKEEIEACLTLHTHHLGTSTYLATTAPIDRRLKWPHEVTTLDTNSMTRATCYFAEDGSVTADIGGHSYGAAETSVILGD
ncbi:MAG TPA: WYL domain-containing protein [Bradyrhizobium sp.]|nr:WYL domain-containing protein [Bradyrhizobium sp.]